MPWANKVIAPLCQVEIHTEKEVYKFDAKAESNNDPSSDLLNITTNKTLSAPTGSWSIELIDNNQKLWYKKINPQHLVVIKMGTEYGKLDTIMVGLVDEIRKKRSVGGKGERVFRTTIVGRDFAKILTKAALKFFPQYTNEDGDLDFPLPELLTNKFLGTLSLWAEQITAATPAVLIEKIIVDILYNLMGLEFKYWKDGNPVDITLKEILRFRLEKANLITDLFMFFNEFEGTVWNSMNGFQHEPFYELFLDTRTDAMTVVKNPQIEKESFGTKYGAFSAGFGDDRAKVVLFFRETPFDKDKWEDLETHEIEDEDIISEDISRSDHDNFNMFHAVPSMVGLEQVAYAQAVPPQFHSGNILKFGIAIMEKTIMGLSEENLDGIEFGKQLTAKLKDWYWRNIWFRNGTQIIRGNGKIKIGHRVVSKESNDVFYVEGVNQIFNVFGNWRTTLSLTRGQEYKEKPSMVAVVGADTQLLDVSEEDLSIPTPAVVPPEPVYYTVVKGDTLWGIATRYYGDGRKYTKIVEANKDIIKNPDIIYPGQRFLIPNPKNKG